MQVATLLEKGRGVPAIGMIISAILATLLILSQVAGPPGFAALYELVVGLSTMAAVIPYAFCALATGLVAAHVAGGGRVPRLGPIGLIAFVFSVFKLYGCGAKPVLFDHARARDFPVKFGSNGVLPNRFPGMEKSAGGAALGQALATGRRDRRKGEGAKAPTAKSGDLTLCFPRHAHS